MFRWLFPKKKVQPNSETGAQAKKVNHQPPAHKAGGNATALSKAHLLLLSKFLQSESRDRFSGDDNWSAVLKEPAGKAVDRLLDIGLIELCDLEGLLEAKFRVPELKQLLKESGLKVSGKKRELAKRLADENRETARRAVGDFKAFICTSEGGRLASDFVAQEKAEKDAADQMIASCLRVGDYSGAATGRYQFEKNRVFSAGLGIDWASLDTKQHAQSLSKIFANTPSILDGMPEEVISELRIAAAMDMLWGTNRASAYLPKGFKTGHRLNADTAARMMIFHSYSLQRLERYRQSGADSIEVSGVEDGRHCDACREIQGKRFSIKNPPELPFPKCTCEIGCRCSYLVRRPGMRPER